jgi:hypothetical protein
VLERDDPSSFWTVPTTGPWQPQNTPRTHVWVQRPGATPRWQRAPQYDLPATPGRRRGSCPASRTRVSSICSAVRAAFDCQSWDRNFLELLAQHVYRFDNGVRLADVNRDGLVDVVWSIEGTAARCSTPARAFRASRRARGAPPSPTTARGRGRVSRSGGLSPAGSARGLLISDVPVTYGLLADLNGDALPDYVQLDRFRAPTDLRGVDPARRASGASAWRRDDALRRPRDLQLCTVPHPVHRRQLVRSTRSSRGSRHSTLDGDGSDDVIGDTDAFLSRSRHSDLVRSIDNGRGGSIAIEYALDEPPARRRARRRRRRAPWAAARARSRCGARPRSCRASQPPARTSRRPARSPTTATRTPRFSTSCAAISASARCGARARDGSAVESFFYQDPAAPGAPGCAW